MQNAERDARTAELINALVSRQFPMLEEYRANVRRMAEDKERRDRAYLDDMRRG